MKVDTFYELYCTSPVQLTKMKRIYDQQTALVEMENTLTNIG